MCESVCKKESACGECIRVLQDAENMTEVVWQQAVNDLVIKHSEAHVGTFVF